MKKLKFGIIGCGGIANQKHLPALAKLADQVELVAFCDTIIERAEAAAAEYGVADALVTEDYKEVVKQADIDVIHVLTPNISHSFITVDALESGKHVMCEKPMAINYEEAKKMMPAVKASLAKSTLQKLMRFVEKVFRPGVFSQIKKNKAAVR